MLDYLIIASFFQAGIGLAMVAACVLAYQEVPYFERMNRWQPSYKEWFTAIGIFMLVGAVSAWLHVVLWKIIS